MVVCFDDAIILGTRMVVTTERHKSKHSVLQTFMSKPFCFDDGDGEVESDQSLPDSQCPPKLQANLKSYS